LGEKLLALPEALDGSQLQPLLPFIGHVFERHVLNLTERCRNPTQIHSASYPSAKVVDQVAEILAKHIRSNE
jgi:hypothetical protein